MSKRHVSVRPLAPGALTSPLEAALAPRSGRVTHDIDMPESGNFLAQSGELPAMALSPEEVTLIVTGWHNVEPGILSWTFPSLSAALRAVRTMKNAVSWGIVSGRAADDLDAARRSGLVLLEHGAS